MYRHALPPVQTGQPCPPPPFFFLSEERDECFCGGGDCEGCSAQSSLATLQTAAAVWQGLSEIPLLTKKKEVEAENGNVHKTFQAHSKMLVLNSSFIGKTINICKNIFS